MIDTEGRQAVTYFTGVEVEHTIMHGERTLFVVGVRPVDEILRKARKRDIRHIYLGTSQSFTPDNSVDWASWDTMIHGLLKAGVWVTLDYGVEYAGDVLEYSWHEFDTFVPMISVKLPYIRQNNYNTTIKIDDSTWGKSNPGVWSHPLNELMVREKFTAWHQYTGDNPVDD